MTNDQAMVAELQSRADLTVGAFKSLVWSKGVKGYERDVMRRRARDLLQDFADTYVENMNQIEANYD